MKKYQIYRTGAGHTVFLGSGESNDLRRVCFDEICKMLVTCTGIKLKHEKKIIDNVQRHQRKDIEHWYAEVEDEVIHVIEVKEEQSNVKVNPDALIDVAETSANNCKGITDNDIEAFVKGFQAGVKWHETQPFLFRLTDVEEATFKTLYSDSLNSSTPYGKGYSDAIHKIFGDMINNH